MRDGQQNQGLYHPQFEHDACGIGFVANTKGRRSHSILAKGLEMLANLSHRGGCGAEQGTGDGAGILMQIPDQFLRTAMRKQQVHLPERGMYGVGMLFLPQDADLRQQFEEHFAKIVASEGQVVIGWRTVPINPNILGQSSKASMPYIRQCFIGPPALADGVAADNGLSRSGLEARFERKLYVIRKRAERDIRYRDLEHVLPFYVASLSSTTVVYKGMLTPEQLPEFYPDLRHPRVTTAIALVHSRFSTNTFPSWERAQPNRCIAHNGEFNTLRGNVNWIHAREADFSRTDREDMDKVLPVLDPDGSDSSMFDNCLEFLHFGGYSLPHALAMMIPEPWTKHESLSAKERSFYEYHSFLMEPWDGPAAIAFSDGRLVGALLDRNGLRPSRYTITKNDLVIMSSEVGAVNVSPENVKYKGRLSAAKMLLVDTKTGKVWHDEQIKADLAGQRPYGQWVSRGQCQLDELSSVVQQLPTSHGDLRRRQLAFGYTQEDIDLVLTPMAKHGAEPIGSMGRDTPLAVLSHRPQSLFNYFQQLFAQVTNPPIDAIREDVVVATDLTIGPMNNLLEHGPHHCTRIKIQSPILSNEQLSRLRYLAKPGFKTTTLSITIGKQTTLDEALTKLFRNADQAIEDGCNILLLSDRDMDEDHMPMPALLAIASLHHHLIREQTRTRVDLVIESGEVREVHHVALLLGYGATAINPYLAFETLGEAIERGALELSLSDATANYAQALVKGVAKIMSKMGISSLQSYRGAQIFEAVGVASSLIQRHFTGTPSRIGGIDLDGIAKEYLLRHQRGFRCPDQTLDSAGSMKWRKGGEEHLVNPATIHRLQQAVRSDSYELYKDYARIINHQSEKLHTLRGLLAFKETAEPLSLDEVEPVESIVRRFKTGAMSYGSLSQEAHESLAIAMNRLGGRSNSGEGGEDPARFVQEPHGDSRCSAIKQVASGRFGVTSEYLTHANELQIKIAQGAKPGEGGQLPGHKVYPWIAKVRHSTPGVGLISPPPHHDIYSIEDLAQLIHDLKNANREARISVKLVSAAGVGTVAAGVAKGRADVILISGYDGGTGASPRSSIFHAGLPWELGLAETQQTLVRNDLRGRVVLETDGKLMTGRDVAIAALLGAEEFGFATAPLIALGCVMMRVCDLDTCPVGVATQNPELRKRFQGSPDHVVNLLKFIAEDLREIMARLGFRTLDEMVGRTDKLLQREDVTHWKAKTLDLSALLDPCGEGTLHCVEHQDHGLTEAMDSVQLLPICASAIERGESMYASLPIANTHRVVGTMTGSAITRIHGAKGMPKDTLRLRFVGSAGQSFGAFIPSGLTLTLEGDANDYVGKGLSGGTVVVYPPRNASFQAEENVIIGNVAFYGATSGEAYVRGIAGDRFCVRNSGVHAVVEGVGDHGCEYMTGGRVVVLGPTGRNFAAGMSGGIAYVYDVEGTLSGICNLEMVSLEHPGEDDWTTLHAMISQHHVHTGSRVAQAILADWGRAQHRFVRVMPHEYRKMIHAVRQAKDQGFSEDKAAMAAFQTAR